MRVMTGCVSLLKQTENGDEGISCAHIHIGMIDMKSLS